MTLLHDVTDAKFISEEIVEAFHNYKVCCYDNDQDDDMNTFEEEEDDDDDDDDDNVIFIF